MLEWFCIVIHCPGMDYILGSRRNLPLELLTPGQGTMGRSPLVPGTKNPRPSSTPGLREDEEWPRSWGSPLAEQKQCGGRWNVELPSKFSLRGIFEPGDGKVTGRFLSRLNLILSFTWRPVAGHQLVIGAKSAPHYLSTAS